jgi:hypothetical protein
MTLTVQQWGSINYSMYTQRVARVNVALGTSILTPHNCTLRLNNSYI